MKIPITGDETKEEQKIKEGLNELFEKEKEEFIDSKIPLLINSSLRRSGGIVPAESYGGKLRLPYFSRFQEPGSLPWPSYLTIGPPGEMKISEDRIDELERRGVIGKVRRIFPSQKEFFIFDRMDARFNRASKHPLGIETYGELKCEAGYEEEEKISKLLEKILSKHDALQEEAEPWTPNDKILAQALTLTCRGEFQCPTNMRRYYKLAGSMKEIHEAGERIGVSPSYDPERRVKSWIPKLKDKLYWDSSVVRKFLSIWKKDKGENVGVTPAYIGTIAYVASRLSDYNITQKEVAKVVGCSQNSIKIRAKKLCRRNDIKYPFKYPSRY